MQAELQQTEPQSVDECYKRYRTMVYRYFLRKFCNCEIAEDLTSEVFLNITRYFSSYTPGTSMVRWITTIAMNKSRDYIRKVNRLRRTVVMVSIDEQNDLLAEDSERGGVLLPTLASSEEIACWRETLREYFECLNDDPLQRKCVLLFVEGYTVKEVATLLHIDYEQAAHYIYKRPRQVN